MIQALPSSWWDQHIRQVTKGLAFWLYRGVDLLFPPQCVACRRNGWWLCPPCAQIAEPVGDVICDRCGRPQVRPTLRCDACRLQLRSAAACQIVRIATIHATPIREAIHALKYDNRPELAEPLARYLTATVMRAPWRDRYLATDGVIPVPLHAERRQARGYNQSELLASAFCRQTRLPLQATWLVRQRPTQSQVGLSATERQNNVDSAFVADRAVQGKRIILVDDVYTTGATIEACAAALHAAGARSVVGLALSCPR